MTTRKKVEVVKKPRATKTVEKQQPSKELNEIEMAMKLGVVIHRTGSHLNVTTYPDGRQELKWDDEALEREVREAIASVENN
jgi:hypothetical protein